MKVVVTGANGLLGREVWRTFERTHDLIGIGRTQPGYVGAPQWHECDLTDAKQTYDIVSRLNADLIVNCAAYNLVDAAESNPDNAYRANALIPRHLALAAQRFDSILMQVSTDYVFDGSNAPATGYREFDSARPLCRYAESKTWGESFVQSLLSRFFIVRTSWLFGPARPTWVDHVASTAQEQKRVTAVKDMVSAPTYTPDLAAAMLRLAESQLFGMYHLTNSGFCNRVTWAQEVLRVHRISGDDLIHAVTQAEMRLPARRPAFSGLQNLTWHLNGFEPLRPWQEALAHHFSKTKVNL
jgi:dTDP-4-dehydrorhamnose reductase